MARELQPSIIFIDEIDSILTERSDSEHEASRRMKTEFLLQFDGMASSSVERILVLAATNRPQEIDEAALRRFPKRIYIPLPEATTREKLLLHLMKDQKSTITTSDMKSVVQLTAGYSGSDLTALAREASLGPIRAMGRKIMSTHQDKIRGMNISDFQSAIKVIRPSVAQSSLAQYEEWNRTRGTIG